VIDGPIEGPSELSAIPAMDFRSLSIPDRDHGICLKLVPDQPMDIFGVVAFIQDVAGRSPRPVTGCQEIFGMRNIVNRVLRNLESGDDLLLGVHRYRGLDEPFSGLSGPPGIVGTRIRTRESRGIDRGDRDHLTPVVDQKENPVQDEIERERPDSGHELLEGREMRDCLEI